MPVTVIEPCVSLLGCKNTRMSVPVVPVLLPGERKKPNCVELPSGVFVPLSTQVPLPEPLHMPCSGSIVVAKAPDVPRVRTPAAAIAARPSLERVMVGAPTAAASPGEDLVFGMHLLRSKIIDYNVRYVICNLWARY